MSNSMLLAVVTLALLASLAVRQFFDRRRRQGLPLPPGPRPLPFIGNVLDLPTKSPWVTYAQWGKTYGGIISVNALGQPIVILNSAKIARDLLEKRGALYSDRPLIPMLDLMGFDVFNLTMRRYSEEWRVGRRIADHCLRLSAVATYLPMQKAKSDRLLRQLLRQPEDFVEHIRHYTAAIAMSLAYGYEIAEANDRYVAIAEDAISKAVASVLPGARLVNVVPALRHLPAWLPGMGFKRYAREVARLTDDMVNLPFAFVKEEMRNGTARPSLARESLEAYQGDGPSEDEENMIKYVAATIYAAGADTTVSVLSTFFLVLTLFPETQRRAQAELDAVVGPDRLPEYADRDQLPYVDALCMELMRWKLVTPFAIVHQSTEDDVYDGYFIPKGTMVMPNTWAMLHDPEAYPDPEAFRPERFLTASGAVREDPLLVSAFGYGRRLCPGRHVADTMMWIVVASVLAAFSVSRAKDAAGREIAVGCEYTDSLVSHPLPFRCAIAPRDQRAEELVRATEL
ncbi:hypothetical protein HETIRDRAFT_475560 [Heterobasidion irregulare TC 32-1]|uniref:Cytochrome P450 n=1 Tax=Heterobasidion irregulare (strain TC 32-1) TaxID=747525 RepID=W4K9R7_HETIT|nr:uncharacterized protein HETIRDRAFT_475560 [Heterobasidion irregulare TC 32-1]ETW82095.1 hypothetical protein HETIRDRAFT_475560 [Heterobasidion irregulare TC 32-1]